MSDAESITDPNERSRKAARASDAEPPSSGWFDFFNVFGASAPPAETPLDAREYTNRQERGDGVPNVNETEDDSDVDNDNDDDNDNDNDNDSDNDNDNDNDSDSGNDSDNDNDRDIDNGDDKDDESMGPSVNTMQKVFYFEKTTDSYIPLVNGACVVAVPIANRSMTWNATDVERLYSRIVELHKRGRIGLRDNAQVAYDFIVVAGRYNASEQMSFRVVTLTLDILALYPKVVEIQDQGLLLLVQFFDSLQDHKYREQLRSPCFEAAQRAIGCGCFHGAIRAAAKFLVPHIPVKTSFLETILEVIDEFILEAVDLVALLQIVEKLESDIPYGTKGYVVQWVLSVPRKCHFDKTLCIAWLQAIATLLSEAPLAPSAKQRGTLPALCVFCKPEHWTTCSDFLNIYLDSPEVQTGGLRAFVAFGRLDAHWAHWMKTKARREKVVFDLIEKYSHNADVCEAILPALTFCGTEIGMADVVAYCAQLVQLHQRSSSVRAAWTEVAACVREDLRALGEGNDAWEHSCVPADSDVEMLLHVSRIDVIDANDATRWNESPEVTILAQETLAMMADSRDRWGDQLGRLELGVAVPVANLACTSPMLNGAVVECAAKTLRVATGEAEQMAHLAVVKYGVFTHIFRRLEQYSDDPRICEQLLWAMGNICLFRKHRQLARENAVARYGFSTLLKCMRRCGASSVGCLLHCCRVIGLLWGGLLPGLVGKVSPRDPTWPVSPRATLADDGKELHPREPALSKSGFPVLAPASASQTGVRSESEVDSRLEFPPPTLAPATPMGLPTRGSVKRRHAQNQFGVDQDARQVAHAGIPVDDVPHKAARPMLDEDAVYWRNVRIAWEKRVKYGKMNVRGSSHRCTTSALAPCDPRALSPPARPASRPDTGPDTPFCPAAVFNIGNGFDRPYLAKAKMKAPPTTRVLGANRTDSTSGNGNALHLPCAKRKAPSATPLLMSPFPCSSTPSPPSINVRKDHVATAACTSATPPKFPSCPHDIIPRASRTVCRDVPAKSLPLSPTRVFTAPPRVIYSPSPSRAAVVYQPFPVRHESLSPSRACSPIRQLPSSPSRGVAGVQLDRPSWFAGSDNVLSELKRPKVVSTSAVLATQQGTIGLVNERNPVNPAMQQRPVGLVSELTPVEPLEQNPGGQLRELLSEDGSTTRSRIGYEDDTGRTFHRFDGVAARKRQPAPASLSNSKSGKTTTDIVDSKAMLPAHNGRACGDGKTPQGSSVVGVKNDDGKTIALAQNSRVSGHGRTPPRSSVLRLNDDDDGQASARISDDDGCKAVLPAHDSRRVPGHGKTPPGSSVLEVKDNDDGKAIAAVHGSRAPAHGKTTPRSSALGVEDDDGEAIAAAHDSGVPDHGKRPPGPSVLLIANGNVEESPSTHTPRASASPAITAELEGKKLQSKREKKNVFGPKILKSTKKWSLQRKLPLLPDDLENVGLGQQVDDIRHVDPLIGQVHEEPIAERIIDSLSFALRRHQDTDVRLVAELLVRKRVAARADMDLVVNGRPNELLKYEGGDALIQGLRRGPQPKRLVLRPRTKGGAQTVRDIQSPAQRTAGCAKGTPTHRMPAGWEERQGAHGMKSVKDAEWSTRGTAAGDVKNAAKMAKNAKMNGECTEFLRVDDSKSKYPQHVKPHPPTWEAMKEAKTAESDAGINAPSMDKGKSNNPEASKPAARPEAVNAAKVSKGDAGMILPPVDGRNTKGPEGAIPDPARWTPMKAAKMAKSDAGMKSLSVDKGKPKAPETVKFDPAELEAMKVAKTSIRSNPEKPTSDPGAMKIMGAATMTYVANLTRVKGGEGKKLPALDEGKAKGPGGAEPGVAPWDAMKTANTEKVKCAKGMKSSRVDGGKADGPDGAKPNPAAWGAPQAQKTEKGSKGLKLDLLDEGKVKGLGGAKSDAAAWNAINAANVEKVKGAKGIKSPQVDRGKADGPNGAKPNPAAWDALKAEKTKKGDKGMKSAPFNEGKPKGPGGGAKADLVAWNATKAANAEKMKGTTDVKSLRVDDGKAEGPDAAKSGPAVWGARKAEKTENGGKGMQSALFDVGKAKGPGGAGSHAAAWEAMKAGKTKNMKGANGMKSPLVDKGKFQGTQGTKPDLAAWDPSKAEKLGKIAWGKKYPRLDKGKGKLDPEAAFCTLQQARTGWEEHSWQILLCEEPTPSKPTSRSASNR